MKKVVFSTIPMLIFLTTISDSNASEAIPRLDAEGQDWVEETLKDMSLEEKVGQLIVGAAGTNFTNLDSDKFQQIKKEVTEYHVGGYHALGGEVFSAAFLIRRMQEMVRIPLFITADLEGGAGLIFRGGTRFPKAMALGAISDLDNIRRVGEITALEARSLGINVNFYPSVDVNNNPRNPIINIRSFGEDPIEVGQKAAAYIQGIQENGILSTAKHFPGHGDTTIDSHLELPVIDVSRERLEQIELPPFRAAIQAGVQAIMTAHVSIPVLEPEGMPATLSRRISTDLLRNDMGFKGLIFTDALNMGGIHARWREVDAAVQAFLAGADVILFPLSVKAVFQGLFQAVQQGKISEVRLNDSVRRILEAKARLGLHRNSLVDLSAIDQKVGSSEYLEDAQEIMDQAITLVRDEKDVLPFSPRRRSTVLLLTLLDEQGPRESRGDNFVREFRRRHSQTTHLEVLPRVSGDEIALIEELAKHFDYLVVGGYIKTAAYNGSLDLSVGQVELLKNLSQLRTPFAFVLLGSPYLLSLVPELLSLGTWDSKISPGVMVQRSLHA
jgi:beta-N-acetylhexosaminidase